MISLLFDKRKDTLLNKYTPTVKPKLSKIGLRPCPDSE